MVVPPCMAAHNYINDMISKRIHSPFSNNSLPFFLLSPILPSKVPFQFKFSFLYSKIHVVGDSQLFSRSSIFLKLQISISSLPKHILRISNFPKMPSKESLTLTPMPSSYLPHQNKSSKFQTPPKRLPRRVPHSLSNGKFPCKIMKFIKLNN